VLTREVTVTPADSDQYEYPFPDQTNAQIYQRYRERAESTPRLLVCGRLGEYRYYDMDQAIARAMQLAGRILEEPTVRKNSFNLHPQKAVTLKAA
jgi:UDP-galactopyranose mutase